MLLKNMPGHVLGRRWPAMLAAQAYQVAYLAAHGRGWPALCGKLDTLRALSCTREKRCAMEATRRVTGAEIEALLCPPRQHGRCAAPIRGAAD